MDERGQMTFYRSYYEAISLLPQKERLALYEAIVAYGLNEVEPALSGMQKAMFELVRPTLDNGRKKATLGKKGGRPKKQNDDSLSENEKLSFSENKKLSFLENDANSKSEKEKEKENENEIEIEVEKENDSSLLTGACAPTPPREKAKRFSPPSVEEVAAYCQERGNNVSASRFVDFYAAKGWKVGTNAMKDWKAAVRTWEGRDEMPRYGGKKDIPKGASGYGSSEDAAIAKILAEDIPPVEDYVVEDGWDSDKESFASYMARKQKKG